MPELLTRGRPPAAMAPVATGRYRCEWPCLCDFAHLGASDVARFVCSAVDDGLLGRVWECLRHRAPAGSCEALVDAAWNVPWPSPGGPARSLASLSFLQRSAQPGTRPA